MNNQGDAVSNTSSTANVIEEIVLEILRVTRPSAPNQKRFK
jgi:hypothetical protein